MASPPAPEVNLEKIRNFMLRTVLEIQTTATEVSNFLSSMEPPRSTIQGDHAAVENILAAKENILAAKENMLEMFDEIDEKLLMMYYAYGGIDHVANMDTDDFTDPQDLFRSPEEIVMEHKTDSEKMRKRMKKDEEPVQERNLKPFVNRSDLKHENDREKMRVKEEQELMKKLFLQNEQMNEQLDNFRCLTSVLDEIVVENRVKMDTDWYPENPAKEN